MAGFHIAPFVPGRLRIAALVAAGAWSVAGCYQAPLVAEQTIALDPALLGDWNSTDPTASESLTVLGVSETEYLIRYSSDDDELRAYLIDVGGRRYLQLFDEDVGSYMVASYVVDGDGLLVRLLEGGVLSAAEADSAVLRRQFLEARAQRDVFGEAERLIRGKPRGPIAPLLPQSSTNPDSTDSSDGRRVVEADVRIGTITSLEADVGPVLVGGRFAVYPWKGNTARRFSVQFVGDYVYRGDDEFFDAGLGSWAKTTDHFFTLSPAVGVDLVRTEHVTLEIRAGPTVVGEERTFSLERDVRFDSSEEFENVCDLIAFRDRCASAYDFSGHVALGFRARPKPRSPFYLGVDYTWLTRGQHQIVGTIGLGSVR